MSLTEPVLYVFFGLIASGKSTLSDLFGQKYGWPCYNTDRVRKELAGLAASERRTEGLGEGIYSSEFTKKTYQSLLGRARDDFKRGACAVILDGSYGKRTDRRQVLDLAGTMGTQIFFILCSCSDDEVKRRLALRAKDPDAVSDGRWDIFIKQKESFEFPDELQSNQLIRLNTEGAPELLLGRLEQFVQTGLDNIPG